MIRKETIKWFGQLRIFKRGVISVYFVSENDGTGRSIPAFFS